MKISATIITLNEEDHLAEALRSLDWADEIIVVDSASSDRTVAIARQFTDKIFIQKWPGYAAQKNFATQQATHDWVFNLDADERVSEDLAGELKALKKAENIGVSAFEMPRKVFYLGRWIQHSGWYPDYKIRLYNRTQGRWTGAYVHESVQVDGAVKRLRGDLLHYTVRNASEHHLRLDNYTTLAAREACEKNRRASFWAIAVAPLATFLKTYIFKLGFLDGLPGFAIAWFAAHYVFLKNLKLWELHREKVSQKAN
ncbi:MAG: glycosyltransferase family 2 protein [Acidobacteria bacterium]|nr:glycosyltransferase family 2 protein [Acidobacteriota bacterium]